MRSNLWLGYAAGLAALVMLLAPTVVGVPLITAAAAAALALSVLAIVHPYGIACGLVFMAAAIPKAGIRLPSLPIPFLLFGLIAGFTLALRSPRDEKSNGHLRRDLTERVPLLVITYGWLTARVMTLALSHAPIGNVVALAAWAFVPLAFVAVASVRSSVGYTSWGAAITFGVIVAELYGIAQYLIGVGATAIPGVTIAFGDDLAGKANTLQIAGAADASKIPSSYQNGNIFGLIAAFFLVLSLVRLLDGRHSRRDQILFGLSAVSVLLSQSRTATVAAVVVIGWCLLSQGKFGVRVFITSGLVALYVLATIFVPAFRARVSLDAIVNGTGAGRTTLWRQVLETMTPQDLLFGTWKNGFGTAINPQAEGWLGIIQQIGLLGLFLLVGLILALTIGPQRAWRLPIAVLAVGAVLDSSYFVFPTLFLPAAAMLAPCLRIDIRRGTASTRHEPSDRTVDSRGPQNELVTASLLTNRAR